ncbi:hypothetical protein FHR81_000479 [Actinoalloteichus hoggarensis]|uniref:hypothetical protein n=1 Tax=Actinoalloteichus hoggarensis TaxID=1470176 RepID=UPI00184D2114|nr:hypothetical protein [Actinoalloteichus hoggarensis]MBB5919450.1 hypothetical protein [Actinoalloteichus hoggarensis]
MDTVPGGGPGLPGGTGTGVRTVSGGIGGAPPGLPWGGRDPTETEVLPGGGADGGPPGNGWAGR